MAYDQKMNSITLSCSSSCTSAQFSLVKLVTGGGVGPVTSATDVAIGIVQNAPALGEEAIVALSGVSKMRAGATNLTRDTRIVSNDSGNAVTQSGASASFFVIGRVLDVDATTNANGIVTVAFSLLNPPKNA